MGRGRRAGGTRATLATLALVAAGCTPAADVPRCADLREAVALPSPAWLSTGALAPPPGDAAAALLDLNRPRFVPDLAVADGWPARPTLVVPLSGPATAVDSTAVRFYGDLGEGMVELEGRHEVSLVDDGRALLVQPDDAFEPGLAEVVLALGAGVVSGASPLPACGPDGEPEPAYAAARAALPRPEAVVLALAVRLSTAPRALRRLGAALEASPALGVAEAEARTFESFGDRAPPPEVASALAEPVAWALLELPDYRGTEGVFELDAEGVPIAQGVTRPGVLVVLPATGAAPHPFVLFQHGGTQDKAEVLALAGPLARAGFALVAIDLPFHGDRAAPGGGGDMDILDFEAPARTRDSLRQASADHLAVLTGVSELNRALEPVVGLADALDPDRGFYMGLSLGGITGSLTLAAAPRLRASALFVGGGGYPELLSHGLFSLLFMDVLGAPELERAVVLGLLEAILDGADPVSYGRRVEDRLAPPRPALFLQASADPVVSEDASDRWARAFGADLALPAQHEVEGMAELALPAADNFSWPGLGPRATRLLVHAPMAGVPTAERHGGLIVQGYSQQMVAHCFSSVLETGSCQVIDTGFAGR